MNLSVASLTPVTGSPEAAQLVLEALVDLRKHFRAQLESQRDKHLAALEALKAEHDESARRSDNEGDGRGR